MRNAPNHDAILEVVRDWKTNPENDGNSPTYQDIADRLGKYRADIYETVQRMVVLGKINLNERGKIVLNGTYIPPE